MAEASTGPEIPLRSSLVGERGWWSRWRSEEGPQRKQESVCSTNGDGLLGGGGGGGARDNYGAVSGGGGPNGPGPATASVSPLNVDAARWEASAGSLPSDPGGASGSLSSRCTSGASSLFEDGEEGCVGDSATSTTDPSLSSSPLPLPSPPDLPPLAILSILSTAAAYGSIATTLFLLTLPIECERIERLTGGAVSKSVALGAFAALAGATQLVSPLVGTMSDHYVPLIPPPTKSEHGGGDGCLGCCWGWPLPRVRGRRLPYLLLGTTLSLLGLYGQSFYSAVGSAQSPSYILSFALAMMGINVVYCVMIALIPDLVPPNQTGLANGTLALLMVGGSLFGFVMFHTVLRESVDAMYGFYFGVMATTSLLTFLTANSLTNDDVGQEGSPPKKLATDLGSVDSDGAPRDSKETEPPEFHFFAVLKRMLHDPISNRSTDDLLSLYWVDPDRHYDFFVVTVSRTFYYIGLSAQAFFLYYVHDVVHLHSDPEAAVATLAIVGQCAGAVTCYPVGLLSDRVFGGRRRPFVYVACLVLAGGNLALLACSNLSQVIGVCAVLGAANGVYLTMDTSLAVDTLPPPPTKEEGPADVEKACGGGGDGGIEGEMEKEKEDGAAQLLGVWGVAGFIGSALGPLLGGPLLFLFGGVVDSSSSGVGADASSQDDQSGYGWLGYCVLFSASAASFLLSAFVLRWVRAKDV